MLLLCIFLLPLNINVRLQGPSLHDVVGIYWLGLFKSRIALWRVLVTSLHIPYRYLIKSDINTNVLRDGNVAAISRPAFTIGSICTHPYGEPSCISSRALQSRDRHIILTPGHAHLRADHTRTIVVINAWIALG